ncbi:phage tail protein [Providencia sp. PROV035]|uniref:phage tail protein n=1 Tax=Providencia sp. PROV035 TaxID=2949766 RepID=UPI00234A72F7|nr:phage tail protein [Providencia sp. PROV035]
MSKLQQLTAFLKANLPDGVCNVEFSSVTDSIQFIPAQRDLGNDQYRMHIKQYDATIAWGRFPYRQVNPDYIGILIDAWLNENDDIDDIQLDLERPSMDVDLNESHQAVVIVTLQLAENVNMREDENGIVPMDGKRWTLYDPDVWIAQEADIAGVHA